MRTQLLPVDRGRLLCPLRGEIDLEQCVSCADQVRAVLQSGEVAAVECRARRFRLRDALAGADLVSADVVGR